MPTTYRYATDRKAARKLKTRLHDVPIEYLLCMDLKHAWDIEVDFTIVSDNVIRRKLVCSRCDAVRYDSFSYSIDGLVKDRSQYVYPEGYKLKGVPRGVRPGAFVRGELMSRIETQPRKLRAVK